MTCEVCCSKPVPRNVTPLCDGCAAAIRWPEVMRARRRAAVARKLAALDGVQIGHQATDERKHIVRQLDT